MPPLHAHLKRGLDYDDFYVETDDTIERVASDSSDTVDQGAKRQRVEDIAAQYLQGRLPVLLTASLRGPFDDGWKNPWARAREGKKRSLEKGGKVNVNKARVNARQGGRKVNAVEVKRRTQSAAKETQRLASPETSRATNRRAEDLEETHTPEVVEVPPATAPEPDENEASEVSEFFSLQTSRCLRTGSPMTDPFWLRRPESEGHFDMRKSTNGSSEHSPTRLRGNIPPPDKRRTLQLAVPKAPVGLRSIPTGDTSPNDTPSCASASVIITSPEKPAVSVNHEEALPVDQEIQRPKPVSVETRELPSAQVQSLNAPSTTETPLTAHKVPTANTVPRSHGPVLEDTHHSQNEHVEEHVRQIVQGAAERLADLHSASQTTNSQTEQGSGNTEEPMRAVSRDIISRPPESSMEFKYKKVGSTKWTFSNAPRSKPRAATFSSSPANKKDVTAPSKPGPQVSKSTAKTSPQAEKTLNVAPGPDDGSRGSQTDQTVHDQQSMGSTRHSAMSTQAAMLLAQLEFQESTFPTSSRGTPRPWSQPQEETPRFMMLEPSPAMTPFSVFRPQLGQVQPATSVLRGPPISTQDLFAAASPFALSTVKKKPGVPQRSNLRTSITSFDGQDDRGYEASPIGPSSFPDRIPLKEKNIVPSPWKFSFDKESRKSQESVRNGARRPISDVELPQLDSQTSVDSYGPNGSFHFTDRLLRNLKDT